MVSGLGASSTIAAGLDTVPWSMGALKRDLDTETLTLTGRRTRGNNFVPQRLRSTLAQGV